MHRHHTLLPVTQFSTLLASSRNRTQMLPRRRTCFDGDSVDRPSLGAVILDLLISTYRKRTYAIQIQMFDQRRFLLLFRTSTLEICVRAAEMPSAKDEGSYGVMWT